MQSTLSKQTLLLLVLTSVLSAGLNSCKKIHRLTQFNLSYTQTVTVPSATILNLPINILTPEITTNTEAVLDANKTNKDLIQDVNLKSLELTVKSPSNGNFNFLNSVSIFVNADGLPELEIASKKNIPADNSVTLTLDVNNASLIEYIKKDKFTLRVNTVTDEVLSSNYDIDLHVVFHVDAKILGQ